MVKQDDHLSFNKSKDFLKQTLVQHVIISNEVLKDLIDLFEPVQFEKNHEIFKAGDIPQYLHFICKGIIKISYYNDEKEIIDRFAEEGAFFGDMHSYITKQPINQTYEAIENVELLRIKYSDIEIQLQASKEVEKALRVIQSLYYSNYVQQTQSIKSLSAEKKYNLFMSEYKHANRIPLKYIANYLGMTPETLSRVRAKYDTHRK